MPRKIIQSWTDCLSHEFFVDIRGLSPTILQAMALHLATVVVLFLLGFPIRFKIYVGIVTDQN